MSHEELWVPRRLGATPHEGGTRFRVFASEAERVELQLYVGADERGERRVLPRTDEGTFELVCTDIGPGALYRFVLDGEEYPDPFARFLPFGVHGPAEVIDTRPGPEVGQRPPPRLAHERVLYELHVGTFTPEGTYAAAAEHLEELCELGITTLELMPVAAFPGRWGWGYDGVAGFAPFAPYGRPEELRRFVQRAHALGLEVLLDVVYNHFGPDGNYLGVYSPRYFDPSIETPWGRAPRFGDATMRSYAIENALYWLDEFGFDGLRFDACHAIHDPSALHVLAELGERARLGGERFFVAEDERNDPRELDRLGVDAVWADDFHHVIHVLLTGERDGYYAGYEPSLEQLARTIERGFLYEGQPFLDRGERGHPADRLSFPAFVYCIENHDQVGNRPDGKRLAHGSARADYLAASTLLLFLPTTPLLFMGQEWAASAPFRYFTDHEPELGRRVTEGRRREFADFEGFAGGAQVPDPQDEATFRASQLDWSERRKPAHAEVLAMYRRLLALRRTDEVLAKPAGRADVRAWVDGDVLVVHRRAGDSHRTFLWNRGEARSLADLVRGSTLSFSTCNLEEGALPRDGAAIVDGAPSAPSALAR